MKRCHLAKKFLASFFIASLFLASDISSAAIESAINLPSQYSSPHLKNKNQYINGPCWAFASIATLETFLKSNGLYQKSLSEQHMLALCSRDSSCIAKYPIAAAKLPSLFKLNCHHIPNCWPGGKNGGNLVASITCSAPVCGPVAGRDCPHIPNGWSGLKDGGNLSAAMAYLVSRRGPVAERDCPYNFNHIEFSPNLLNIKPQINVNGIKKVPTDVYSLKKAILEYSAVTAVIPARSIYFHAVSIVGWDDKIQKWLVKDSARDDDNYTFIPYSTKVVDDMCITEVTKFDPKQKIYQHDEFGVTASCFTLLPHLSVANVFNFEGNEELESIMINSSSPNARISLYLAPVLRTDAPNSNRLTWRHLHSSNVPYDGYFTFSLQNKVKLNRGKYAIIAQMDQTNQSTVPKIGCMVPQKNLNLNNNIPDKSFILSRSTFCDVTSHQKYNSIHGFSIKAITKRL